MLFFYNLLKYLIKKIAFAIHDNTFYPGVEFYKSRSVFIEKPISIGKGTRLHVLKSSLSIKNIYIGKDCWIGREVEIQSLFDSKIIIKSNVSIQDRCKILGDVEINKDSLLAPDVFLSSGNHFYSYKPEAIIKKQDKMVVSNKSDFQKVSDKIVIGEDCWIGKSVIIKQGIRISRGSIIGANSIVTKNVPPYEIWAGNPAKFLKKRLEFIPKNEIDSSKDKDRPYFYLGFCHDNIEDGLISEENSICILNKIESSSYLYFDIDFLNQGFLSIYIDDIEIYNKKVLRGRVSNTIFYSGNSRFQDKSKNLYEYLLKDFEEYSIVRFSFIPEHNNIQKLFKLYSIKINFNEKCN